MPKAENSSVLVHYLRPPRAGADFRRQSPPKCRRRPKHAAAVRIRHGAIDRPILKDGRPQLLLVGRLPHALCRRLTLGRPESRLHKQGSCGLCIGLRPGCHADTPRCNRPSNPQGRTPATPAAAGSHGTSRSTPSRTSCTCLNINLIAVGQVRSGQVRSVVLLGRSLRPCGHAGRLPILGYPVTKMLAHMLARAVGGPDFRPSRNGDGTVPAGAHSLRACRGAMARRRRLLFDLNAVAYTQSTNTLSMRSPNANLIYSP